MSYTQSMRASLSTLRQMFPPSPHWTAADMPDLAGKTVAVTGGYAGIGFETCKALLEHGARVVILGRSASKAEDALERLEQASGGSGQVEFVEVDLADLKSVRKGADEVARRIDSLDVLFNNGGVMFPPAGSLSAQGVDLQFATNVLGHFFLTNLLVPLLDKSAFKADGFPRVVNTSSSGHWLLASKGGILFDTLKVGEGEPNPLDVYRLYGQSKLGNILFANEFQRRHPSIVSVSLNPGNLKTELSRHTPSVSKRLFDAVCYEPWYGALTQLWAGTSAEGQALGGKYLGPWAREVEPLAITQDKDLAKRMWDWCAKECEGF